MTNSDIKEIYNIWFNENIKIISSMKVSEFKEFVKKETILNCIDDKKIYMKTEVIKINGNNYLIDEFGTIWSHDNNNDILGITKDNNIEWF